MIVTAPAKINLALHITDQRADGYHMLESLVVFAKVGDRLTIESASEDRLSFSGPFGGLLQADKTTNLVLKARDAVRGVGHSVGMACPPVSIHLEKNLPLSSGIGGGSADAAAVLKALNELWALGLKDGELDTLGLTLGADVPMCLYSKPLIASGIGEVIAPVHGLPDLALVLVNPGAGVSTPQIFRALANKSNPSLPPVSVHAAENSSAFIDYLKSTRNDLQTPAVTLYPPIAGVLNTLTASGALFARMSGSGATCFGIFETEQAARMAASEIAENHKNWWVS